MSEKSIPTYDLTSIKKAFNRPEKLVVTSSAKKSYIELGFTELDVVDAIQALTQDNFFKSMSPYTPGFINWQDVYKSRFRDVDLYIKFQVNAKQELILSFKER